MIQAGVMTSQHLAIKCYDKTISSGTTPIIDDLVSHIEGGGPLPNPEGGHNKK